MRARCSWFWLRMLGAGLCLPATLPAAVTNYVTTRNDGGGGSFRQAILDVNAAGGGRIIFSNITGSLVLTDSLPVFGAEITLIGPGTNFPTMSAGSYFRTRPWAVVKIVSFHLGSAAWFDNDGKLEVSRCLAPSSLTLVNNFEFQMTHCSQMTNFQQLSVWGRGRAFIQDQRFSSVNLQDGSLDLLRCICAGGTAFGRSAVIQCTQSPVPPYPVFCSVQSTAEEGRGGGILVNSGALTLTSSTVSNNWAQGGEGGSLGHNMATPPADASGGGIYIATGTLMMTNCTICQNTAKGGSFGGRGGAGKGGGICVSNGTAILVNCTVSGNRALGSGLAGSALGAAVYVEYASLQLINCTITGNIATPTDGGLLSLAPLTRIPAGVGIGGLWLRNSCQAQNSIIAVNTGAQPYNDGTTFAVVANDGKGILGGFGHNLIGTTNPIAYTTLGSTVTNFYYFAGITDSDRINPFPYLGPLQDNGGPVFTHALLAGSPAIDAGTNSGLAFDARGQPRTIDNPAIPNAAGGDGTDIGAFEVNHILTGTEVRAVGSEILVRFTSVSDKTYGVQYKSEVNGPAWITLPGTVSGTGGIVNYTDVGAANLPRRFYRLFERTP